LELCYSAKTSCSKASSYTNFECGDFYRCYFNVIHLYNPNKEVNRPGDGESEENKITGWSFVTPEANTTTNTTSRSPV
jgi:hypothetical protein